MSANTNEAEERLNLQPSTFKFHQFTAQVGEVRLHCHVVKMKDSLYMWIGDAKNPVMNDLSLALLSRYDPVPLSTKVLGAVADTTSTNMAQRLSKKTGKPIYVSFNVNVDNITLPGVEKSIQEELAKHPHLLKF